MIRPKRRGPYNGVWLLVDQSGSIVSDEIWFDEARARKAAEKRRQTDLFTSTTG